MKLAAFFIGCTKALALGTAAVTLLGIAAPVHAQYPDRPIRLIVTYPAGGATDVVARAIAARLGERLKQPVVVDNRPGASGMIGADLAAKAAPDGYTLIFAVADTHSINPHVYSKISYDARKDATPVGLVGYLAYALIVQPGVKASTVPEFVALARSQPGKLTYASWGIGSSSQVSMELFKADAKIDILHVPFQGAAPAIAALIGGQVDAFMVPLTLAEPNSKANKVRLLALASPKRFSGSPDVPTFAEQGMPLTAGIWLGIMGPAGLPPNIVTLLNRELNAVLNDPQSRETLVKNGLEPMPDSVEGFKALLEADYEKWGKVIKNAGIRAD